MNVESSQKEQLAYQDSLKYYRDLKNVTDTAREEGWEEGKAEGLEEGKQLGLKTAALNMANNGLTIEFIANTLNQPVTTIQQWLNADSDKNNSL